VSSRSTTITTTGLPLHTGASGEAVRDLQRRLAGVGLDTPAPEGGRFGPSTEAALRQFQHQRGLVATGICDQGTWSALVEAGYRLGDRLLYLRSPMLRGDDVAELQLHLGSLGFDAGRVDGIFGPDTEHALKDFQRNAGLTTDGVGGRDVVAELERLGAKADRTVSVAGVRERELLRHAPRVLDQRRIIIGEGGGLDAVAGAVGRLLHEGGAIVAVLHHPDPSVQAAEANEFEAELYLHLAVDECGPCRAAFYATAGFESSGGHQLAQLVLEAIAEVEELDAGEAQGMRLPVLRETRMPAVVCWMGPPERVVEQAGTLADALARAVRRWAETPFDA